MLYFDELNIKYLETEKILKYFTDTFVEFRKKGRKKKEKDTAAKKIQVYKWIVMNFD